MPPSPYTPPSSLAMVSPHLLLLIWEKEEQGREAPTPVKGERAIIKEV